MEHRDIRMNLLTLNEDVLITLVSHLDPASARQLSYTARAIHDVAQYRALQSITLHSFVNTVDFCKYMLGRMPHCLPALHELRLHCEVLSADQLRVGTARGIKEPCDIETSYREGAVLLNDVLRRAASLRVLVMASAEAWMAYEPQMVHALSSVQTLQEIDLELVEPGVYTSKFVNKMLSAPRKLAFRTPYSFKREPGPLVLEPQLRLPSVKSLCVNHPDMLLEPTDLARAFPGTENFIFTWASGFKVLGPQTSIRVTWPTLERIRGSVALFRSWRSTTAIHLLQFVDTLSSTPIPLSWRTRASASGGGYASCSAAIPVVNSFQPVALILEVDVTTNTANLEQLFAASKRLRYLSMAIDDHYRQSGIGSWWRRVSSALIGSSIICFELRVTCGMIPQCTQTDLLPYNICAISYKQALMRVIEDTLPDTPSTLRYLSLDCSPAGDSPWKYDFLAPENSQIRVSQDEHWWLIEGKGPQRVARVIDADKGEHVAAYLRSIEYDYTKPFDERDVSDFRFR